MKKKKELYSLVSGTSGRSEKLGRIIKQTDSRIRSETKREEGRMQEMKDSLRRPDDRRGDERHCPK